MSIGWLTFHRLISSQHFVQTVGQKTCIALAVEMRERDLQYSMCTGCCVVRGGVDSRPRCLAAANLVPWATSIEMLFVSKPKHAKRNCCPQKQACQQKPKFLDGATCPRCSEETGGLGSVAVKLLEMVDINKSRGGSDGSTCSKCQQRVLRLPRACTNSHKGRPFCRTFRKTMLNQTR